MKNKDMITRLVSLDQILSRGEQWPRRLSFAITKNLMALQELYRPFEKERDAILEKYARKEENGEILRLEDGQPDIPDGVRKEQERELEELLDISVDFHPHKVTLEDLPEHIDAKTLYMLEFMIEE